MIELLLVISIIVLLAGLVIGGATVANAKKTQSRVTTERAALEAAIERYHKAKGFYPPDNPYDSNCVVTQLFYELTGMSMGGNPPIFTNTMTGEVLTTNQIGTLFNNSTSGIINSSADPSSPAQNFFGGGLRTSQYLSVQVTNDNNLVLTLLGIPVSGPVIYGPAPGVTAPIKLLNPWHYNISHPTNNQGGYDLWMNVQYGGHTYCINNWSKDPQVLK